MSIFLQIAAPVPVDPVPPWYVELYRKDGLGFILFILIVLAIWKWGWPEYNRRQLKVEERLQKAEDRLLEQIREGKEQVLRSEGRADKMAEKFSSSLDQMLNANDKQLTQFDHHLVELKRLRESVDKVTTAVAEAMQKIVK